MSRRLWAWLRMLAALAILGVLAARLGAGAFLDGLRAVSAGAVLAALGIGLLTTLCSAGRWCLVARRLGLRLGLPSAVADYYRALLLNAVLPAGVLGDAHRAVRHGRRAGDLGRSVRAVVLERTGGQVVTLGLGVAVLLAQPALVSALWDRLAPGSAAVVPALAAVALAGALGGLVALCWWARRGRRAPRWRAAISRTAADARVGLLARGSWPGVLLLSSAALLGHLALFLVAARAAGVSAPVGQLLAPLMLALLVMGLPINVGGWGPREAVAAFTFGTSGLVATQGLTAAVVYGVLAFVASLPGAAALLLRSHRASRPGGPGTPTPVHRGHRATGAPPA